MLHLFDVTPGMQTMVAKPRAADVAEVVAYLQWQREKRGLPDMLMTLEWKQPRDWRKGQRYCVGATFGTHHRGEYEDGSYSIVMPGANHARERVTFETLDDAGEVVATSSLPIEPKKGGVIWSREEIRAAAGKVAKAPARKAAEKPAPMPVTSPEAENGPVDTPATHIAPVAAPEAEIDPVANLLARVEALEAAIATLSGESSRGAIGEIEPMPLPAGDPRATGAARARLAVVSQQQPKRSAAHERAIRRAWVERKARREAEAERLRVADLARDARAERDTLRQQLENARRAVEDQREVSAAFEGQWRMAQARRLATAQRARRMIATARKAERFQRQRGDVLHAQLARLRSDMVDPSQPERASDIARLIRERDEARNAAAASQARAVRAEAATATMADKFEDLVSRVARAEAALRKAA